MKEILDGKRLVKSLDLSKAKAGTTQRRKKQANHQPSCGTGY
jgi:hypothetical protein